MTGVKIETAKKLVVGNEKHYGILKRKTVQLDNDKIIMSTFDIEFLLYPITVRLRVGSNQWKITVFIFSFGLDIGLVREGDG